MDRLTKIGSVKPVHSTQVKESTLGLGFEKLDRAVFDPEKAYDKVAALGVKWIRIQSGWARTEKEPGVYDFAWFDDIGSVSATAIRSTMRKRRRCSAPSAVRRSGAKSRSVRGSVTLPLW